MKVLISLDASETAEKAFDWYFKNLHACDNEVVVAHVSEPPKLPTLSIDMSFPADEISKLMTEKNKKVNDLENKYTTALTQKKVKHKFVIMNEQGNAGEYLVKVAKEQGVDMILMGSRGLGTVRRTILGSVSDYVIHHTKIPVCIVPKS